MTKTKCFTIVLRNIHNENITTVACGYHSVENALAFSRVDMKHWKIEKITVTLV